MPVYLVYSVACADKSTALKRERQIKHLTRQEKLALCRQVASQP
jgi:predicted GIY-YIG superfamily endonuclease